MGIIKLNYGKQRDGTYRREMPRTWFLSVPFYALYMLREATAVITLFYTIILMFGLSALSKGEAAFLAWAKGQQNGLLMWFSVFALALSLFHTATWFAAAPKAMDVRVKGKKVPDHQIIAANWGVLFVVTVLVLALCGMQ